MLRRVCCLLAVAALTAVAFFVIIHTPYLNRHCLAYQPTVVNINTKDLAVGTSSSYNVTLQDMLACGDLGCDDEPVGLAFSGGGWKALAQHMGTVRGLVDAGIPLPTTLTANSGGAWFLLLLSHSPRFFTHVEAPTDDEGSKSIGDVYRDFMEEYRAQVTAFVASHAPEAAVVHQSMDECMHTLEDALDSAIVRGLRQFEEFGMVDAFEASWNEFISTMLDGYTEGFTKIPLDAPLANPSLAETSVGFQLSFPPSAYLGPGGDVDYFLPDLLANHTWARASVPVAYFAGKGGLSAIAPDLMGSVLDARCRMMPHQGLSEAQVKSLDCNATIAVPSGTLTVGIVASGSSSAAGFVASPQLFGQFVDGLSGDVCFKDALVSSAVKFLWPIAGIQNLATCTTGEFTRCDRPSWYFLDGGYTDNGAVITSLVKLQRQYPQASRYKLFASFSNSCRGDLSISNCNDFDNSMERLFANQRVAPSGSRYPSTPGTLYTNLNRGPTPTGTLSFSQQVFAESAPDWSAHGDTVFRTMVLDLTTVDNPVFGVRGGSNVRLMVVYGNVGNQCPTLVLPDGPASQVEACASLADGMRQFYVDMASSGGSVGDFVVSSPIASPDPRETPS